MAGTVHDPIAIRDELLAAFPDVPVDLAQVPMAAVQVAVMESPELARWASFETYHRA